MIHAYMHAHVHRITYSMYIYTHINIICSCINYHMHFPRSSPLCRNSPVPVNSPNKSQWRGALMFSLICVSINSWVNNREAGDVRDQRCHYDVNVMLYIEQSWTNFNSDMGITTISNSCQTNVSTMIHWDTIAEILIFLTKDRKAHSDLVCKAATTSLNWHWLFNTQSSTNI